MYFISIIVRKRRVEKPRIYTPDFFSLWKPFVGEDDGDAPVQLPAEV